MKKIRFDVVTAMEHDDESEDVLVRIERTKTFYGAESYQQALDYYDKRKQAYDILYQTEEGGLFSREVVDGKEYKGEYCEWYTDTHVWLGVHLNVMVTNN